MTTPPDPTGVRRLVAAARADFDCIGTIAELVDAAAAVRVSELERVVGIAKEPHHCGYPLVSTKAYDMTLTMVPTEWYKRLNEALAALDAKETT